MSEAILALNVDTFKSDVLNSEIPVLVDFWAPWCGPCRMIAPIIEELADELDGEIKICKLNTDEETDLAIAYGVSSIPTLILFRDGEESGRIAGLHSKEAILEFIGK